MWLNAPTFVSLSLAQLVLPLASNRTSLLFESPHISMAMGCFQPPSRIETLDAVERICDKHDIDRFVVGGHSFGSITAGWLATSMPWRVAQAIFLDPVVFLLVLPDVCYNFVYRATRRWIGRFFRYFTASEITINNALRRHFWWYEVSRNTIDAIA